jgi:cytoskeletal protein RodZ
MSQIVNGPNTPPSTPKSGQKIYRPGQRQQERLQRLARRRRRNRIITSTIAAVLLVVLGTLGVLGVQNYQTQQAAIVSTHATATAKVEAQVTATAIVKDCFLAPSTSNAPAVPSVYGAGTPSAGPTNAPAVSGTPVTLSGGLK